MPTINENTTLLYNGHAKSSDYSKEQQQSQAQEKHPHYIDVLDKPISNGFVSILDEDRFSAELTLEELLPFVDDPWWQKLRLTAFCTFILVFCLILIDAIALAYMQHGKLCHIPITVAPIPTTASTTIKAVLQKI